jgi:hypothetical protein
MGSQARGGWGWGYEPGRNDALGGRQGSVWQLGSKVQLAEGGRVKIPIVWLWGNR